MPDRKYPKGARTPQERKKIAEQLVREIDASINERSQLRDRWERNEAFYRDQDGIGAISLADGIPARHIPLVYPKVNMIVGTVYQTLTGVSPMLQAIPANGDNDTADAIEQDVEFLLSKANFDNHLWSVLEMSAILGVAALRPRIEFIESSFLPLMQDMDSTVYDTEEGGEICAGVVIDRIHAGDLINFPSWRSDLSQSKTVGHRMPYLRAEEVRELQRVGRYLDETTIYGGDEPEEHQIGRDSDFDLYQAGNGTGEPDDNAVELYELVSKMRLGDDKEERYYRCVVAKTSQTLLDIEEWPYSRPPYFDFRFHDEYGKFWPSTSIAQHLQGLQLYLNDLMHLYIGGVSMAAFPPLLAPTGCGLPESKTKYGPGEIIEVDSPADFQPLPIQFNPQGMMDIIQFVMQLADSSARISQVGTAQQFKSGTTATEASGILAAQQAAQNQYTARQGLSLEKMWPFIVELYRHDYDFLKEIYGDALKIQSADQLKMPVRWEVNGKQSGNTPEALLQKLQLLLAMVQADPNSPYDPIAIQKAIVQALTLPFKTEGLMKSPPEQIFGELGQMTGLQPQDMQALQSLVAEASQLPPGSLAQFVQMLGGLDASNGPAMGGVQERPPLEGN